MPGSRLRLSKELASIRAHLDADGGRDVRGLGAQKQMGLLSGEPGDLRLRYEGYG